MSTCATPAYSWPTGGIAGFYNLTKKPLTLHNRWFSSHNNYTHLFNFTSEGDIAIPSGTLANIKQFFKYLMRFQDDWGLAVDVGMLTSFALE